MTEPAPRTRLKLAAAAAACAAADEAAGEALRILCGLGLDNNPSRALALRTALLDAAAALQAVPQAAIRNGDLEKVAARPDDPITAYAHAERLAHLAAGGDEDLEAAADRLAATTRTAADRIAAAIEDAP